MVTTGRGLAGVEVDASAISEVDGARGALRYRGYAIEDLAARADFVEVVGLVLDGELPRGADRAALEDALRERALPPGALAALGALPRDTHPMTALQVALPLLDGPEDKARPRLRSRAEQRARLLALGARLPALVATWDRLRRGLAPLDPDPALALHDDFLRMVRGARPDPEEVRVLDVTQALQLEHGFNASTFAGRVVASTLAPLSEVLSACVAALHGPLHGGADEAAWRLALELGDAAAAPAWVEARLAAGEKIMGLGHREYRVVDPRARVLRPLAVGLARRAGLEGPVGALVAVDEHAARWFAARGKQVHANVEFYKGAVFAALGLAPDLFTALFAMARVWGWGAHALEVWDDHALVRPRARYVGPPARALPT